MNILVAGGTGLVGSAALWRYAPIPASQVGRKLVEACLDAPTASGGRVLEGLELRD